LDTILVTARLLLAFVFLVAGAAKLTDREGSRRAVEDFGVPATLATPLGTLLPLLELTVAVTLIPASAALWGASGALALLVLFVIGIGVNLARGRNPQCHCFGQLHSAPAGWYTLARTGALAAVAGFVAWQGWSGDVGSSAVGWLGALSTLQLLALAGGMLVLGLLMGQWWFLFHLLRQQGRLLVRLEALEARYASDGVLPSQNGAHVPAPEGLPLGSAAPRFSLSDLDGETLTLDSLRASNKPVMLLFTDSNCSPCTAMLPEIGLWQEEHQDKLTIALVSQGDSEENRDKASEHSLTNVMIQEDSEVSEAYAVSGTPSAMLVSTDGTVASPVAGGTEHIRDLLAYAIGEHVQLPMQPNQAHGEPCPNCGKVHGAPPSVPAARAIGEPAPEVKLPDLEGETVDLEDFRGTETLVLFWNPGCGFCQQMLPEMKESEQSLLEGSPKLLFVSAGTEEANRQMGLASTVVLDQQFSVGRAFGASGTPCAVLVDGEGKVASEVAVGSPGVLELAGANRTKV